MILILLFIPNKIYSENQSENLSLNENYCRGQIEVISEPIFGQNKNFASSDNPEIAVENDKIYVVWDDMTAIDGAGTDNDIFYRYYDGTNWSDIQIISEPIPSNNINTGGSECPVIAVENGKIYVAWADTYDTNGAGSDRDIFYRCNLTGSGWEDIQVISEPILGNNFSTGFSAVPTIVVENNNIYVAWHDSNNTDGSGTDADIFFRCNLTSSGWEDIQIISEPVYGQIFNDQDSWCPSIAVENNKLYIAWDDKNNTANSGLDRDVFYRCNLSGISWEDVQVLSEPIFNKDTNTGLSGVPSIAVENSKIYVTWVDSNNTNNVGTDDDIFFRCNLTGYSWEDVQVISEPVPGMNFNTGYSEWPAIAVENDKIHIVWHDWNNTNNSGTDADIFYKRSLTGSSWDAVKVISEPVPDENNNIWESYHPEIVVNFDKIYLVWEDCTNIYSASTDSDIFYMHIPFFPPVLSFSNVDPISGNTSTNFNFSVMYTDADNEAPKEIMVNISGINYSILEVNPVDTNYMDGKNYFYSIKHLNIGLHTYQFWVSDGFFRWHTSSTNNPIVYNTPPNITTEDNLTAIEDTYYEVIYEYEDIDIANVGQLGTWNFSTNASWLAFNSTTALLNGTPTNDDVGQYWVNITINDTMDIDYTNFTLTVIDINDPPIITTPNVEITYEDELYEVDYDATDIDSPLEDQIWSLNTNASSWLIININYC